MIAKLIFVFALMAVAMAAPQYYPSYGYNGYSSGYPSYYGYSGYSSPLSYSSYGSYAGSPYNYGYSYY